MQNQVKIKVIKKQAVEFYKTPKAVTRERTKRDETREIVSTVSGWISEFQLRNKKMKQTLVNFPF